MSSTMGTEIRPTTILPARRTPLTLHTADGLRLVGELAGPLDGPSLEAGLGERRHWHTACWRARQRRRPR